VEALSEEELDRVLKNIKINPKGANLNSKRVWLILRLLTEEKEKWTKRLA
jgi:hypothetical protein